MNNFFRVKFYLNSYFRGYFREYSFFLKSLFADKNVPEKKFVIFTGGRTGSTLLVNLLNEHPDLHCDGELLKGRMWSPFHYLKNKARISNHKIYGFKLLSYQLRDIQNRYKDKLSFLKKLQKEGYKIIYVERENKAYQSLSILYAMNKDQWHKGKSGKILKEKINLKVSEFQGVIHDLEELTRFEKELLENLPHLKLSYELDLQQNNNHAYTVYRVCQFLGIKPVKSSANLRKILPKRISGIVENAAEILTYLRETKKYEFIE